MTILGQGPENGFFKLDAGLGEELEWDLHGLFLTKGSEEVERLGYREVLSDGEGLDGFPGKLGVLFSLGFNGREDVADGEDNFSLML
ncbi:hypothetical protein NPIL_585571 [Nephila pilipes]|uniref:Uncharacterized protein n=1 Tax=Nephila pilipes TaxID=299642 RepID=A0A8X6J8M8_NEPPI|nr:hypothetical protein NPIL_585571 [Nephila pilipes]